MIDNIQQILDIQPGDDDEETWFDRGYLFALLVEAANGRDLGFSGLQRKLAERLVSMAQHDHQLQTAVLKIYAEHCGYVQGE